jgi:hypothetical protein
MIVHKTYLCVTGESTEGIVDQLLSVELIVMRTQAYDCSTPAIHDPLRTRRKPSSAVFVEGGTNSRIAEETGSFSDLGSLA